LDPYLTSLPQWLQDIQKSHFKICSKVSDLEQQVPAELPKKRPELTRTDDEFAVGFSVPERYTSTLTLTHDV
jgi:hypothetical protein